MSLGFAKSDDFVLGSAALLIGPTSKVLDLNLADHGVGLVKNFTLSGEPQYTELTQGPRNELVHSTMTRNDVRATAEMYEFSGKNLRYALGLDGSTFTAATASTTVATEVVGDDVETELVLVSATGITAGDYILIDYGTAGDGGVLTRKVASVATNTLTLTRPIPTGVTVGVGATVKEVVDIAVGSVEEQPFLSAMVVGPRVNGKEIVIHMPKIRITKGFTLAYTTEQYGNLPFEMSIYNMVSTDTFYADPLFANRKAAIMVR